LWSRLDELSPARAGLADALRHAHGNPLALRNAHAGLRGPHPSAALYRSLPRDQRQLAGLLALVRVPVPNHALRALLPAGRAGRALDALERKLIVEREQTGHCGIDRELAEAVRAILDPATRGRLERAAWRCLVECAPKLASELLRSGHARDLRLALEAMPERLRTPALRVTHARALTHLLELTKAQKALAALRPKLGRNDPSAILAAAQGALWRGDLAAADELATSLLGRGSGRALHALQVAALKIRALAWTLGGRGEKVRPLLEQAAQSEGSARTA